jgi:hypothetical protein
MAEQKTIDIALIYKSRDDQGNLLTRTLPDGSVVPAPLIVSRNYGDAPMPEVRISFWDLDHESLEVRLDPKNAAEAFDAFARQQHERMQDLVRTGQLQSILDADASQRRIAELERKLANKEPAAGQVGLVTQD